jgi:hypothetical protein
VLDDDRGFLASLLDFSFDSTISGTLIRILYGLLLIGGAFFMLITAARFVQATDSPLPFLVALIVYFVFVVWVRFLLESMMMLGKIAEYTRRSARLLEQIAQATPARSQQLPPAAQPVALAPAVAPSSVSRSWTVSAPATAPAPTPIPVAPPAPAPGLERLARQLFSSPELGELPRAVWAWAHGGDILVLRRAATTALAYAQLSPQSRAVVEALVNALGQRPEELRRAVLALG